MFVSFLASFLTLAGSMCLRYSPFCTHVCVRCILGRNLQVIVSEIAFGTVMCHKIFKLPGDFFLAKNKRHRGTKLLAAHFIYNLFDHFTYFPTIISL